MTTNLEALLGHTFKDRSLLERALTHGSWIEEQHPGGGAPHHLSQQRLEFAGDAFLNFVLARELYRRKPEALEGELTPLRARYAKGAWLEARGQELELIPVLRLGKGARENVDTNGKVHADTVEALIGAIVEDGASSRAYALIVEWMDQHPPPKASFHNPTGKLQEWHQKRFKENLPDAEYSHTGPDNGRTWTCTLTLSLADLGPFVGTAGRKPDALKAACNAALLELGITP